MAVTSRETQQANEPSGRFVHAFAVTEADIKACQQLRYRIFAEEMGAQIDGGPERLDIDRFDAYCHHLVVRDTEQDRIIACTRLLTCEGARGGPRATARFATPSKAFSGMRESSTSRRTGAGLCRLTSSPF